MQNTLIAIKKLIAKSLRCNWFYLLNGRHTTTHT